MLPKSLRYARQGLSSFGFVFLVFMGAYALMDFALFGRVVQSYEIYLYFKISINMREEINCNKNITVPD